MIRLLRGIGGFAASRLGRCRSELQESLASHWVAIKLRVECGDIDPTASIYVPEIQPGRGSGYMTVQSVLKTVQGNWGHWDRETMAWWCEVLERANRRFGRPRMTPSSDDLQTPGRDP